MIEPLLEHRRVFAGCTTRVLEGEGPPRRGGRFAPDARLELLAGIGHCPQVEAPERFTELLLAFGAQRAVA